MKSPAIPLPDVVRNAVATALDGRATEEELAWMSWAGTVWRITAGPEVVYLKRAAQLAGERDRLEWLAGRWPVPEVAGFVHAAGDDWLLTRGLAGVPMSDPSPPGAGADVAARFGAILRTLHAADATGCPFGVAKRGHVLIHGDYCLPNVLVAGDRLAGVVDVGGCGLGDPEIDLAAGVWTLQYNFGKGVARVFLDEYGWPPMTDEAIEKLRRRYAR